MKNLGEKIDVSSGVRSDDGTRLEPEEQLVKHSILTAAEAKHGESALGTSMRAALVTEMSAIEAAETFASPCHLCAHWRPDEWPLVKRKMEATAEGRDALNRVRGAMLAEGAAVIPQMENNDDLSDVEHALGSAGVCKALSDLYRDDMVTMPTSSCPATGPDGSPLPSLFVARRGDSRRASISTRDTILRMAQGRGK